MDGLGDLTGAKSRSRSRRSIAHLPLSETATSKENLSIEALRGPMLASPAKAGNRKSRSKSIGPGGLDALRDDSGNRQKSTMAIQYKSILKPTIPLSPPKPIPPHGTVRTRSPAKPKDKSSPATPRAKNLVNPSQPEDLGALAQSDRFARNSNEATSLLLQSSSGRSQTRVAVRTEEQQQQAAMEEHERQLLVSRKDARRKSLANRRVSFAPEATLHTWDVVEMPEDSTTSSASTSLTRRASGLTAAAPSPDPQPRSPRLRDHTSEQPSTPPQQTEEVQVRGSPDHQRDLHQKKRRRSSGIPPMNFNNPDDFSSSPYSAGSTSSDDANQVLTADDIDVESSDSDDKDLVEDETVTGIDGEDAAVHSDTGSNTGSSARLEEALRQAAEQAGTQGISYDEYGDITMEMADDEVTTAFKPWTKNSIGEPRSLGLASALQDQERINPFSQASVTNTQKGEEIDQESTMELTKAVGTILPKVRINLKDSSASLPAEDWSRSTSTICRRGSSASLESGDETMELTVAVGGIDENSNVANVNNKTGDAAASDEEELSMEFTAAVGGVLADRIVPSQLSPHKERGHDGQKSHAKSNNNSTDVSAKEFNGKRIPSTIESAENTEDITLGMDITTALGMILPQQLAIGGRAQPGDIMVQGVDFDQRAVEVNRPTEEPLSDSLMLSASKGDPSRVLRQNPSSSVTAEPPMPSKTPKIPSGTSTPCKVPATPSKQITPKVVRPTIPGKTPPPKNVALRTGSPKKLFKGEIKTATTTPDRSSSKSPTNDLKSNQAVKSDIGTVFNHRRLSGLGLDRNGIGSPRVTELLKRRSSINESSEAFRSNGQPREAVRFTDPLIQEHELEQEGWGDEQQECGRNILQMGADESVSSNLKDRIQSLTPQKKRLNGRKSLHVGAAKGILGKRPVELDNEEDEDENTTKHLRVMEGSPIKRVKLPAPPKHIVDGRILRSARAGLGETSANVRLSTPGASGSPLKGSILGTPTDQSRFKDANIAASSTTTNSDLGEVSITQAPTALHHLETNHRIHLQDFLNLTSIRFMELTTTKRRHTVAPRPLSESVTALGASGEGGIAHYDGGCDLGNCVVAGACTIPMLDLYQHSCRELKKYIAEGRNIVREIEAETFEDNPILFREYLSAPADVKTIMDNRFKNVKTHARLLSKAMWYEWRMKLLDGLKEGLVTNMQAMQMDAKMLTQQEHLIQIALPDLTSKQDELESNVLALKAQAEELASCDPGNLKEARSNLITINDEIRAKRRMIEDIEDQLRQTGVCIENSTERRDEFVAEIHEAEKIQQESRGWDLSEIRLVHDSVKALERTHGWTVDSAVGETLTMTYKCALQLYFIPGVFNSGPLKPVSDGSQNAPISLAYIAQSHGYHLRPLSTEQRFFLQSMRAQLQFLQQSQVTVKGLLTYISTSWDTACQVAKESEILGVQYMTEPIILSDETMSIQSHVLLRAIKTKVYVSFEIRICSADTVVNMEVAVRPSVKVVYGEELNAKKMEEFLGRKLDVRMKGALSEIGQWAIAVGELEQRLVARGLKS